MLVKALDRQVVEREGSRVKLVLNSQQWCCHRPYPGKEARKYQVKEARELFERADTARIMFDERDNLFVGRVLGVSSMISFHGETVAQLYAEFEKVVDDCLADCREQGISPEKPASGRLMLRI